MVSYKFRIYPDEEQKEYINHNFYCSCFVYNYWLKRRNEVYNKTGKNLGIVACCVELKELKHTEPYKFLEEADSTALQQAIIDLDNDFQTFFKKKTRQLYPKFKKKVDVQSFRIEKKSESKNIYFANGYIKIPKIEKIRLDDKEIIPEDLDIHYVTISKNIDNEYYVIIT